jgi:integrase
MGRRPNGASTVYKGADGSWHGRVTFGVRPTGHPTAVTCNLKSEAEVIRRVCALEKERDNGTVRKSGQRWTVKTWLTHWVETIAAPSVKETTMVGYRAAVYKHLIPGIGAHRLDRLEPEHLELLYAKMMRNRSASGTAHQTHRTIKTALNVAVRRGHLVRNVAQLAKPPPIEKQEIEPFTVEEAQRLLAVASSQRNGVRFALALALGIRKGEALGTQVAKDRPGKRALHS